MLYGTAMACCNITFAGMQSGNHAMLLLTSWAYNTAAIKVNIMISSDSATVDACAAGPPVQESAQTDQLCSSTAVHCFYKPVGCNPANSS